MLAPASLLAAAGGAGGGSGPTGAPTDAYKYFHSGTKIGVAWVNADETASTQVWFRHTQGEGSVGCPSVLPDDLTFVATVGPGVTSYNADETRQCSFYLRHFKFGIGSSFIQVVNGLTPCVACG